MEALSDISGYKYSDARNSHSHAYLLPTVKAELARIREKSSSSELQLFELGCGNGSLAAVLTDDGWNVAGVDPSVEGIKIANSNYPLLRLEIGSASDDLAARFGRFPAVISLEVVEHVYAPRDYAATIYDLLKPGGTAIISTPYHGYLKNLALAASGKMDEHFTALWDHGHIKFWSIQTLTFLLQEAGFQNIRFVRVGRVPALAKSMIAVAQRPER